MRKSFQRRLSLSNKLKKWQWASIVTVILSGSLVWGIYKTEFLAGFWGIKSDEIAVITIEGDENGQQNVTIKDPSKSFWDVLELLVVPLVLVGLGAWFQKTQQEQAERLSKEQREQDADETREEVLQLYFDRISTLLIDKNLMEIAAKQNPFSAGEKGLSEVSTNVITARTLSILRRFRSDSERKSSVINFLAETGVISRLEIDLSGTDLSGVNLIGAELRDASLFSAELSGAKLGGAELLDANLRSAKLNGAKLDFAKLNGADLDSADLCSAELCDAKLCNADLSWAKSLTASQLETALLCCTQLPEYLDLDSNRDCEKLGIKPTELERQAQT